MFQTCGSKVATEKDSVYWKLAAQLTQAQSEFVRAYYPHTTSTLQVSSRENLVEESPLNDSFTAAGEILQKLAGNQMTYDTKMQKNLGTQTAMHDLVFQHYGEMLVSKV